MYDARTVANFLLDLGDKNGVSLTNISINKILYFAHGIYLNKEGRPLVKNSFEAWDYGPVVRVVYDAFKRGGSDAITTRAQRFNPVTHAYEELTEPVDPNDQLFLRSVFDMFSAMSAGRLIDMSHSSGSPWANLWESDDLVVRPGMVIADAEIASHVRRYAN